MSTGAGNAQRQPDLVISSGPLTATPASVAAGEPVQLSAWTVKNQGAAASGSFSNGFYLSTSCISLPNLGTIQARFIGANDSGAWRPTVGHS